MEKGGGGDLKHEEEGIGSGKYRRRGRLEVGGGKKEGKRKGGECWGERVK